jgi:hypothetical protein
MIDFFLLHHPINRFRGPAFFTSNSEAHTRVLARRHRSSQSILS